MNNNNFLKESDSGSDVILLQQLLRINNYFPASITGVYGPDTVNSVTVFQKENNLEITGTVTEETWEYLYKITNPASKNKSVLNKPILEVGIAGQEVKEVQSILKSLGYYNGSIDGQFDEEVYESVAAFQFVNKLVPDGIVGPNTWSALIDLYEPLAICGDVPNLEGTYTVKAGDTLYSISKAFNTTVDELKRLNNLIDNTLSIGQVLIIDESNVPEPEVPTSTYTVKAGDTLYSIATKNNMTVDELIRLNNLTSNILSIGQVLKINSSVNPEPEEPSNIYIVKAGDTLYGIARKYNTTVDNIIKLNNLTSNILSIGQSLIVTGDIQTPDDITYTVKAGDTLYGIARKYNTTVDSIISKNNLASNILSIGQVLKI